MTFDGLRVEHSGLDQAADDLLSTVREIDERLQRLAHELAPLRSEWNGQAQLAYHVAQARWDAAIGEMRALLGETGQVVRRSNADYRAADLRGAAAFGGR